MEWGHLKSFVSFVLFLKINDEKIQLILLSFCWQKFYQTFTRLVSTLTKQK